MSEGAGKTREGCGGCRFFLANKDSNPKDPTGLCRRYPPQGSASTPYDNLWPMVSDLDWCGEYQRR